MSENSTLLLVFGVVSLVAVFGFLISLLFFKNLRDRDVLRIQAEADARIREAEAAVLPVEVGLLMPNPKRYHNGVEFELVLHGTIHHLRITDRLEEQVSRVGGNVWKKVSWSDFISFCEAYYLEHQSQAAPIAQTTVTAPNGASAVAVSKRKMKFNECRDNVGKVTYTQAQVDGLDIHNQFKWVSVGPDEYAIEHI